MTIDDIDREFASLKDYRKQSMYRTKHFKIYELVPKAIYYATPESKHHRLWQLFDDRALITLDLLRDRYGSATVNDWYWGGSNEFGGWRPGDCKVGSELSQHKRGRAFDPKFKSITADEIRKDILKDQSLFPFITCLEMGVSWLHFDTRNWTAENILQVNP